MTNKYIKTVAGGENTSPAGTEAILLDDGSAYKYSLLTTIRTFFKTTYDAAYMAIVAPSTSGNVLTSNGTIWTSAAPTAGTYTPTLTNTTNVASSTASVCSYMRVGNVVNVSGSVVIDVTSAAATVLGMSLPYATDITYASQLGGTANAANGESAAVLGSVGADAAYFSYTAVATGAVTWWFNFTYCMT